MPKMSDPSLSEALLEYHGALFPRSWVRTIEDILERIAAVKPIIVVRGESGTGRDTMVRVVHAASPRGHQPLVKIRCGARPLDRLATELFGHEQDAFPGSGRRRIGKLEFAHGGTLFLDEIEDLPRSLEPALLETLRDGSTARVGGRGRIPTDIQVVATTRQMLLQPGSAGGLTDVHPFRVVDIEWPPLRTRRHEIVHLASDRLRQLNAAYGRDFELRAETFTILSEYEWPGNVRELTDLLRQAVISGDESALRHELEGRLPRPPVAW